MEKASQTVGNTVSVSSETTSKYVSMEIGAVSQYKGQKGFKGKSDTMKGQKGYGKDKGCWKGKSKGGYPSWYPS